MAVANVALQNAGDDVRPPQFRVPRADRTLRCVLMDDSAVDRQALLNMARTSRYQIEFVETESIRETREVLSRREADILVLDHRVCDGDGIGFASELAEEARHSAIPVIVVSGETSEASAVQAIRCGAADYLAKTELTTETFDQAVENALRRSTLLPADQRAMMSNLSAENETLRRIALRNMRLLKGQAMPLMAFAWRVIGGDAGVGENRDEMAAKLARLTRNITGLIDDTVITSATHRANEVPVPVDLGLLIANLLDDDLSGLGDTSAHIRVGALPTLVARPTQMAMLFEELLLIAIRSGRLGQTPEIEVGAGMDTDGNPIIWLREDGLQLSVRKQSMAQRFHDLVEPPAEMARDEHAWSLCQRLVERNNGEFKIAENDSVGSRVMMRFPKDMIFEGPPGELGSPGSEVA